MPFVPPSTIQFCMAAAIPAGVLLAVLVARALARALFATTPSIVPSLTFCVPVGIVSGISCWDSSGSLLSYGRLFLTLGPFAGAFLGTLVTSMVLVGWIGIVSKSTRTIPAQAMLTLSSTINSWIDRTNAILIGLGAGSAMIFLFSINAGSLYLSMFTVLPICLVAAGIVKWTTRELRCPSGANEQRELLAKLIPGFAILGMLLSVWIVHVHLLSYFWGTVSGFLSAGLATLLFTLVSRSGESRRSEVKS